MTGTLQAYGEVWTLKEHLCPFDLYLIKTMLMHGQFFSACLIVNHTGI